MQFELLLAITSFIGFIGFIGFILLFLQIRNNKNIKLEEEKHIEILKEWWDKEYSEFLIQIKNPLSTSPFRMNPEYALKVGIILNAKEQIIIHTPCILSRNTKTGIKYSGGTKGMRVTPIKGISFNIGASKGRIGEEYLEQKDLGYLTLTSKRIIFTGNNIQFAVERIKVNNISLDNNHHTMIVDLKSRDVPDFNVLFLSDVPVKIFTALYSDSMSGLELNFINT